MSGLPYFHTPTTYTHGDLVRSRCDPSWGGSVTGILIREGGAVFYFVADASGDEIERSPSELEPGKAVVDPETADRED